MPLLQVLDSAVKDAEAILKSPFSRSSIYSIRGVLRWRRTGEEVTTHIESFFLQRQSKAG
jgi:hypothetical protein